MSSVLATVVRWEAREKKGSKEALQSNIWPLDVTVSSPNPLKLHT